jgi:hypothetical protein
MVWMTHMWKLIGLKRGTLVAVTVVQLQTVCERVVVVMVLVEWFVHKVGLYGEVDLY